MPFHQSVSGIFHRCNCSNLTYEIKISCVKMFRLDMFVTFEMTREVFIRINTSLVRTIGNEKLLEKSVGGCQEI